MGVFTPVSESAASDFLKRYDLGDLIRLKGIQEGVENTNYQVETTEGAFVLTLFEGRTEILALPFFIQLMSGLAANGFPCPVPIADRRGEVLKSVSGRPAAILSWLEGEIVSNPDVVSARLAGRAMAELHIASRALRLRRPNHLGLSAFPGMVAELSDRLDEIEAGLERRILVELIELQEISTEHLPQGIIHADLFPDNVLLGGGKLTGVIDFYMACTDRLAYDVGIALNAWAMKDGRLDTLVSAAFTDGYQSLRRLSADEIEALPALMRVGALRFLLSRAKDWLDPPSGALVTAKDPKEYISILDRIHEGGESFADELLQR